jgi:murein DD-endopeptidase MepM/ murein hydrolase activator NlpD
MCCDRAPDVVPIRAHRNNLGSVDVRSSVRAVVSLLVVACALDPAPTNDAPRPAPPPCGGFDWPVGLPDAAGYYDAQPFGVNGHLGEDWNGQGGGDSDLGDPVFAIADGVVTSASHEGAGWGNVVRVAHECGEQPGARSESLYAHLSVVEVTPGAIVLRGQRVGTIGTADGQYPAHLHLELRNTVGAPTGGGYGDSRGHLAPSAFIARHRPR